MNGPSREQELYHEIFGSILDRREMTPYLLLPCDGYESAIRQSTLMMGNRGFDVAWKELCPGEKERALDYVEQATSYFTGMLFPFVEGQLRSLAALGSPRRAVYEEAVESIENLRRLLDDPALSGLIEEDPRHLFLLSSSIKYPNLFLGYSENLSAVPSEWQRVACATLKMCHLIKGVEENSQDINDYARLGIFLETSGAGLENLFDFDWNAPSPIPDGESARRAFARLATFFRKLNESISYDERARCLVFDSGDGVRVRVARVRARLKSPESMFAKLGKEGEEEAHGIRDILAITFILQDREDSLTLFHALQKRGVILQENTLSTSITQTLFDRPEDMEEAVRRLMLNLARSAGSGSIPTDAEVRANAAGFFGALGVNAVRNPHSSDRHRKFQCKIDFSLPVHRDTRTGLILVPGTREYAERDHARIATAQTILPVELRISDLRSWEESEQRGEAHHDAYKFRQLIALMNRLFAPLFRFPPEAKEGLKADQERLFR